MNLANYIYTEGYLLYDFTDRFYGVCFNLKFNIIGIAIRLLANITIQKPNSSHYSFVFFKYLMHSISEIAATTLHRHNKAFEDAPVTH